MTTQPAWDSVDNYTADLLTLVANDQMTSRPAEEWDYFVECLKYLADLQTDRIDPNRLRRRLRGEVAPHRIGAFTLRAKAEGLIVDTGEWQTSDDAEGRNAGKPCRVYRLAP